ncbi:hypothetical protein O181_102900 [Austropuccinia psidii MF-1]|uniref:Uncharacterized protein n=1 Tax=Austropuccinia psidii MF-1 TaxID=1389203 RepID=A0A9Q3JKG5_9BASI|nr:hypothetical protein [Austropuccinia psidii MF-1]
MSLSGINIDVENTTAQNSSTWSIPNISITPIPPNASNTQIHVSEGLASTPETSQRLIPNKTFPHDFLLNLVRIQLCPRIPLDQVNSQPSIFHQDLRFMWGMKSGQQRIPLENVTWSGLLEGNPGLTLNQKKVTGNHNPYASKPRTAHASSSRDNMVDDEDENISPNQSETNDDPRRDNFMAPEEGTK